MLLLWAGAISLFYHQWGKIRGLDDYQPDFVHANMTLHHNPLPEEGSEVVSKAAAFCGLYLLYISLSFFTTTNYLVIARNTQIVGK